MKNQIIIDLDYTFIFKTKQSLSEYFNNFFHSIVRELNMNDFDIPYDSLLELNKESFPSSTLLFDKFLEIFKNKTNKEISREQFSKLLFEEEPISIRKKCFKYFYAVDTLFTSDNLKDLRVNYEVYLIKYVDDFMDEIISKIFLEFIFKNEKIIFVRKDDCTKYFSSLQLQEAYIVSADVETTKKNLIDIIEPKDIFNFSTNFIKFESPAIDRNQRLIFDNAAQEKNVKWQIMISLKHLRNRLMTIETLDNKLVSAEKCIFIGLYFEYNELFDALKNDIILDHFPLIFLFCDPLGDYRSQSLNIFSFKNAKVFMENNFSLTDIQKYVKAIDINVKKMKKEKPLFISNNYKMIEVTFLRTHMLEFLNKLERSISLKDKISQLLPEFSLKTPSYISFSHRNAFQLCEELAKNKINFPILIKPQTSNKALSNLSHLIIYVESSNSLESLFNDPPPEFRAESYIAQNWIKCNEVLKGYRIFGKCFACWQQGIKNFSKEGYSIINTSTLKEYIEKTVEPSYLDTIKAICHEIDLYQMGNYGIDILIDMTHKFVYIVDINPSTFSWTRLLSLEEIRSTFIDFLT